MEGSMLAAVLPSPGAPLQLERIPMPRPRRGEMLVRVAACGVCHTDLHVMKGEVAFPCRRCWATRSPARSPSSARASRARPSGRASSARSSCRAASATRAGRARDDLCGPFFAMNRLRGTLYDGETRLFRDDGTPLAMYSMGGLAEYAVVPATAVFPLGDSQPLEESAILGCAALTAYGAVRQRRDPRRRARRRRRDRRRRLARRAARRLAGAAQVVAVDIGEEKLAAARRLGATDTVDASAGDPVERVLELTGGGGDARLRGARTRARRSCRRSGWCATAAGSSRSGSRRRT